MGCEVASGGANEKQKFLIKQPYCIRLLAISINLNEEIMNRLAKFPVDRIFISHVSKQERNKGLNECTGHATAEVFL
jgi:hypothetical protein